MGCRVILLHVSLPCSSLKSRVCRWRTTFFREVPAFAAVVAGKGRDRGRREGEGAMVRGAGMSPIGASMICRASGAAVRLSPKSARIATALIDQLMAWPGTVAVRMGIRLVLRIWCLNDLRPREPHSQVCVLLCTVRVESLS